MKLLVVTWEQVLKILEFVIEIVKILTGKGKKNGNK